MDAKPQEDISLPGFPPTLFFYIYNYPAAEGDPANLVILGLMLFP